MLGVFAEFERSMIQERVRAGLARAKAKGKKLGRPPKVTPRKALKIDRDRQSGMTFRQLATKYEVGINAIQRALDLAKAQST